MEHYRIAIGLTSPHLTSMPETPRIRRRRMTQSAKPLDGDKTDRDVASNAQDLVRAPSAPSGNSFI